MKLSTGFFSFALTLLYFLLNVYCGDILTKSNTKQLLEIGIGIGIGIGGGGGGGGGSENCPPPPPPPVCPPPLTTTSTSPPPPSPQPPLNFLDERLIGPYRAIQRLKRQVTDDPKGITKTWTGEGDLCNKNKKNKYMGFYCASPPDNKSAVTVASIDFNGFDIAFNSIEDIADIKDLAIIHANSNRIKGTIPLSFANYRYLYELDVSNNLLSGSFPPAVLGIRQLLFLDLRFNNFTGTVPAELFLRDLDVIFLNNNNFAMRIPDSLGQSPVAYLTFANNKFTGPIPRSIYNMSENLAEVLFLNNYLSGCLPNEIGFLKEATVFDAGSNRLTGPVPFSFGCLSKIEHLNLARNYLYGQVPEVVCALGKLVNLSLSDNYFNALGPQCQRLAKKGVLDDRKNCIPGRPNQRSPPECAAFYCKPLVCPCSSSCSSDMPCNLPHLSSPSPPLSLGPLSSLHF